jgi:1,4-alpha-glucan branching enzyme
MPAKKVAKKKASKTEKKIEKVKESFELHAPEAGSVLLAGDFTEWETNAKPMKRLKSGIWKVQVALEATKSVQYRFLVDGAWVDDPKCQTRMANGMGGHNCLRQAGA